MHRMYRQRLYRNLRSRTAIWLCLMIGLVSPLWVPGKQLTLPAQASVVENMLVAWGNLFRSPPPPPRRGTGRGDFCLIAPQPPNQSSDQVVSVWSRYPTLVWRGSIDWIELRSPDNQKVLAQLNYLNAFDPNDLIRQVTYQGAALQPGQTYTWVIKPRNLEALKPLKFQVLAATNRNSIEQALQALEANPKTTTATPEAIAIQRADYFANRQLWSDFWQTVLTVKQPSPELKTTLETTVTAICNPPAQSSAKAAQFN